MAPSCLGDGLVSAREEKWYVAEFLNSMTNAQMSHFVLRNSVQKMVGQEERFCFSLFY